MNTTPIAPTVAPIESLPNSMNDEGASFEHPDMADQDAPASFSAVAAAVSVAAGVASVAAPETAQAAVSIGAQTPVQSTYDGWRFLTQATFGPTASDMDRLSTLSTARTLWTKGYSAWLDEQFALKPSKTTYQQLLEKNGAWLWPVGNSSAEGKVSLGRNQNHGMDVGMLNSVLWEQFLTGKDQLRQRVAFALSEIFVVSLEGALAEYIPKVAAFHDILVKNAFGSFRTLVEDVCRSPAMGMYLTYYQNKKPGYVFNTNIPTRIPDQNFARELMQLFTIGLVKLKMDGTPELDSVTKKPKPTYTPEDIKVLSHVFTGWAYWSAGPQGIDYGNQGRRVLDRGFYSGEYIRTAIDETLVDRVGNPDNYLIDLCAAADAGVAQNGKSFIENAEMRMWDYMRKPMVGYDENNPHWLQVKNLDVAHTDYQNFNPQHSKRADYENLCGSPTPNFLGSPLAVNYTCEGDMRVALDRLFAHQNIAPFIAKQMIQRLVTSNPSPAYVQRVATQFKASSFSLKTLVKAILLDTEARDVATISKSVTYGKLREPLLRTTAILRGLKHVTRPHLSNPALKMYAMNTTHPTDKAAGFTGNASALGQGVFYAPSVFNFFRPGYVPSGTEIATRKLVAPEFQISSGVESVAWVNATMYMLFLMCFGLRVSYDLQWSLPVNYGDIGVVGEEHLDNAQRSGIVLDFTDEVRLLRQAGGTVKFLDNLSNVFFGGKMTAGLRANLSKVLENKTTNSLQGPVFELRWVQTSYLLAFVSAEFVVQK